MVKTKWKEKGYVDEPVPAGIDLKAEIRRMAREKNAVILAHYYTDKPLQEVADFIGDSLALARKAAQTDADIIVMCGVHFMGETNKVLCPQKKVLIPDLNAFCKARPDHTVISYVNTSAAVKAVTDVVVTSSNARQIVESLPKDEKIIFGPDRNLGEYINQLTGRCMVLWNGACHVHERFSVEKIMELKRQHPQAKVLAHPECKGPVVKLADVVGSTAALLRFTHESDCEEFIVATESGILFEMERLSPAKRFYPVPPVDPESNDKTCMCNECAYMRLNTLEKLYNTLRYEWPEVKVPAAVARKAVRPIDRMLEISEKLGI